MVGGSRGREPRVWRVSTGLALLCALAVLAPASATASTFSNPTPIAVPATGAGGGGISGVAGPYPSTIDVSGVPGTVVRARVTFTGIAHTFPSDIDTLLVAPGGRETLLMSAVCSAPPATGSPDLTGQSFTFDDAAIESLPTNGPCSSGTFKPTRRPTFNPVFQPPAPTFSTTTAMSALNGSPANGTWSLFVIDHSAPDTGTISGGWTLDLLTDATCAGLPATMIGTAGPDLLTGTPAADVILGFDGNDTISGLQGSDLACGGNGRDTLGGGKGRDRLFGEAGKDKLIGGKGRDRCVGGASRDAGKACEKGKI
jgi:RTX calcium-binding nonapeptide repeat (4 copies)